MNHFFKIVNQLDSVSLCDIIDNGNWILDIWKTWYEFQIFFSEKQIQKEQFLIAFIHIKKFVSTKLSDDNSML